MGSIRLEFDPPDYRPGEDFDLLGRTAAELLAHLFPPVMDAVGIQKTILLGSSRFTITLNPSHGFTDYDANNNESLAIATAFPERFEAWPTIDRRESPAKTARPLPTTAPHRSSADRGL